MSVERYYPRGIGRNYHPCYICKASANLVQYDMAAFVDNKEAGEHVVAMYEQLKLNAVLDYRLRKPNWVQVKVGACKRHLQNLKNLERLVCNAGNVISPRIIVQSTR